MQPSYRKPPGNFDADCCTDAAMFRPSTGTWYELLVGSGVSVVPFGARGDQPAAGDYDGDGRTDPTIYRASSGQWWLRRSRLEVAVFTFGNASGKAVPGDYTGDAVTDVAFWRRSTGEWFILRSENQSYYSLSFWSERRHTRAGRLR